MADVMMVQPTSELVYVTRVTLKFPSYLLTNVKTWMNVSMIHVRRRTLEPVSISLVIMNVSV